VSQRCGIHEKRGEIAYDQCKLSGSMVDIGREGRPLPLLQRVFSKCQRERVWPIRGNRCSPAYERRRDGPR
jgi:hypothetical protein